MPIALKGYIEMRIREFSGLDEETLHIIISKHYNYWSQFSPTMDLDATIEKFTNIYAANDEIPFGIAMFEDTQLIGFCVFKNKCLEKYPQFFPWISSVMIFDDFRGQGYGRRLITEALKKLFAMGYSKAYLWTDQTPGFYEKMGFKFLQVVEKNEGGYGNLFCKETMIKENE